jgi:hypothetical protein
LPEVPSTWPDVGHLVEHQLLQQKLKEKEVELTAALCNLKLAEQTLQELKEQIR